MTGAKTRERQAVLFDWGDTVMRVFPEFSGPMESWPRVEEIQGGREAIQEVRRDALVCLATNAIDSGERAIKLALDRVGLAALFDRVFCYEVVGYRKPSVEFYDIVLKLLRLSPENVFMVGDDFAADVQGAIANGIRSVWLNRHSLEVRRGDGYATIHSFASLTGALAAIGFERS